MQSSSGRLPSSSFIRRNRRSVNQALMELGATVCSFKSPRCLVCPLNAGVLRTKTGTQDQIRRCEEASRDDSRPSFAVVAAKARRYLMRKQEGLWEFPMFGELAARFADESWSCRHTITHHRLEVPGLQRNAGKHGTGFKWQIRWRAGVVSYKESSPPESQIAHPALGILKLDERKPQVRNPKFQLGL